MNLILLIKISIVWAVICLSISCLGQSSAPLGALPMQYNSSFAGSNGGPRVSAFTSYENYVIYFQNNLHSRSNTYRLYTSYDQFIPLLRSGIGITAGLNSGSAYENTLSTQYKPGSSFFSLAVAPKFSIKGKYTLSPSVDFAYTHAWNQFYGITLVDSVLVTHEVAYNNLTSRAGILFNTNKYYIGYSVRLMNRTIHYSDIINFDFLGDGNYFNSYLQLGYTLGRSNSKFSFTPQIVFQINRGQYDQQLRINFEAIFLGFRYKEIIWGLNNAGIHLGWQQEKVRLMLTSDLRFLTIPQRNNISTFNVVSLSFRYLIPSKMEKKYTVPGQ